MIPYQICGKLVGPPFGVEVIITLGTSIPNILPIFLFLKYLLEYKIGRVISEIEFSNLPGVQPDKIDYRKPIPNPNILPDCFSELLK